MADKSTALARVPDRDAGLSAAGKAKLAEIRARNLMVATINSETWGNKVSPDQARAYAEYMRRFNLDISEVDILGGRPRRNGQYYKRRIMEMADAGKLDWVKDYHIGPDPRLDALAAKGDEWAVAEQARRLRARILHAVPEKATHAFVVEVKIKALAEPLDGCKWYVPGRTKLGWSKTEKGKREQVPADPVGDENPVESVETRAWARVGKLVAAQIPELRAEEAVMETAERDVGEVTARIADDEDAREAAVRDAHPLRAVATAEYEVDDAPTEATRVHVEAVSDPYGDADAATGELFAEGEVAPAPKRRDALREG